MATAPSTFLQRLTSGGIEPGDSSELQLHKTLLFFATGLISAASILWLVIYWLLGPQVSATLPLVFQALLATNVLIFIATRNFVYFRTSQLGLFLFMPFVVQWSMGNMITSSGVILWGLLAPVGALLFCGVSEAVGWFIAYIVLTAISGLMDWYLADSIQGIAKQIPPQTTIAFFALNFLAVSSIVFLLLRFSTLEREKMQLSLAETHRLLQIEQERSERLLLNILPDSVAERLKNSNNPIADGFADVTVMFADIVNFTQVAAGMAPKQVFAMLNSVFSSFDELAEKFGLEKIKTIGDAYMVAGGVNSERSDYSDAIAEMALEMRDLLHRDYVINQMRLEIRIGIGTGPVVAGVVGKKKFIYDLWGDTVNLASRITTEGVPGMIQTDATTYRRLRERFDFHEPQTIYLKGKGNMTVYRLIGRRGSLKTEETQSLLATAEPFDNSAE